MTRQIVMTKLEQIVINSEGEKLSILQVANGPFTGQHILCIFDDDEVSDTVACHLLDRKTIDFLLEELSKL